MTDISIAPVEQAVEAIKKGEFVILLDEGNQPDDAHLVIAADFCTADKISFMAAHGRSLVCIAMHHTIIDRLQLPLMLPPSRNTNNRGTGFTVSVESNDSVTNGISASDRAQTIKLLIDPVTKTTDLVSPGHMFPLRATEGGVLTRQGKTEASVELSKLASLKPASVVCALMNEQAETMSLPEVHVFASAHNILVTSISAIAQYQQGKNTGTSNDDVEKSIISMIGKSQLPTEHGIFDISIFRDQQGHEHSLLTMGKLSGTTPLVRLHSECLTGDAFGSMRCDCGQQLQFALRRIAEDGCGALVYLRQEGRGIGLGNKIRAYELQDSGMDTVDANHQLGFPADARVYDTAAHMLQSLAVSGIRLMTNNPDKVAGLESFGINVVEQVSHQVDAHEHNASYLKTKAQRMGHKLD